MDIVPMVFAGFGGVFLGSLLTARVLGWLHAIAEARGAATAPTASVLVPVLLHSGPWLLAATLVGGFFALTRSDAEGWLWFFGGVVVAPLVLIPVAILISRRAAKSS